MICPTCKSNTKIVTFNPDDSITCSKCKDTKIPCYICGKQATNFVGTKGYCSDCI